VYAKELASFKKSILSNTSSAIAAQKKGKTLLDQPISGEGTLNRWRDTNEASKLAAAATPLYWMAKCKNWELKTFTLVLSKALSDRLDTGDATASSYIRDQLTRRIPEAVAAGAEFLYGLEKAPVKLADGASRRRWHLHGLIIGPVGFSAQGPTPIRKALQAIKGEADADLMFKTPGEQIDRDQRASAVSWGVYAVKNGLSVELNPALRGEYDLPPGKQTFISATLRREAKRWHEGRRQGRTSPELITEALRFYEP